MIGLDTSFLIDLYWQDSPRNKKARALFKKIADDNTIDVAIFYNCFNEFLHVITDSKRFENPLSIQEAIEIIDFWCDIDRVKLLYPDDKSFKHTIAWFNLYNLGRNRINDTQMAAVYLTNGISKIITANPKDFMIFNCFEIQDYSK